jgi:hypothetical protein
MFPTLAKGPNRITSGNEVSMTVSLSGTIYVVSFPNQTTPPTLTINGAHDNDQFNVNKPASGYFIRGMTVTTGDKSVLKGYLGHTDGRIESFTAVETATGDSDGFPDPGDFRLHTVTHGDHKVVDQGSHFRTFKDGNNVYVILASKKKWPIILKGVSQSDKYRFSVSGDGYTAQGRVIRYKDGTNLVLTGFIKGPHVSDPGGAIYPGTDEDADTFTAIQSPPPNPADPGEDRE